MLSKCLVCNDNNVEFYCEDDFLLSYYLWKTVTEERVIKNIKKTIIKSKELKQVSHLKYNLKKQYDEFKKHSYYVKHQASELKK